MTADVLAFRPRPEPPPLAQSVKDTLADYETFRAVCGTFHVFQAGLHGSRARRHAFAVIPELPNLCGWERDVAIQAQAALAAEAAKSAARMAFRACPLLRDEVGR